LSGHLHPREHVLPPQPLTEHGKEKHQPPIIPNVFQFGSERGRFLYR